MGSGARRLDRRVEERAQEPLGVGDGLVHVAAEQAVAHQRAVGAAEHLVDVLREREALRVLLPVGQLLEREAHQAGVDHLVADRGDHVVLVLEALRGGVHEDGHARDVLRRGAAVAWPAASMNSVLAGTSSPA